MARLLMVDNYDSFTYNIVQYFGELGADVTVVRNDETTVAEVEALMAREGIERLVISPGPARPTRPVFRWLQSSTLPERCRFWASAWATRALARPLAATSSGGPADAWQDQRDQHRPEGRVCRPAQAVHGQPLSLSGH